MVAVSVLGACSGVSTSDRSSNKSATMDSAGGSAQLAAELNDGPAIGTQTAPRRDVIYNGSLTIRVSDAEQAADRALALADDANGYLSKQDSQLEGDREVKVTLRVPASRFDDVMTKAAKLGTVQARTVDSEDVTDQVVDLKGRLANAQASTERLRALLAKAENVANIATLEDRLTQREAEIEQISGQIEVLQNDVTYATVRLTLTEKDAPTVSKDLPGPLESLRAGAIAVVNILVVALAAVAFAVPFLPFVLLAWFGFRWWRKRHPKAEPRPFPPATGGWPGAPAPPPPAAPPAPAPETALGATEDAPVS